MGTINSPVRIELLHSEHVLPVPLSRRCGLEWTDVGRFGLRLKLAAGPFRLVTVTCPPHV
jgi:hypothetical protein